MQKIYLISQSTDEDYYKPIKITSVFDSKGDKNKNLSVKEYLYMIRPYLCYMINDH